MHRRTVKWRIWFQSVRIERNGGRLRKGAELDAPVNHLLCYHGKIPKRHHWTRRGMYSLLIPDFSPCPWTEHGMCEGILFIYLFLLDRGQEVENEENTGTNPDLRGLTSVTFVLQLGPTSWKFLEPPKIMATAGDHTFNTWAYVVIFKQAVTFHRAGNRTQQIYLPFSLFFLSLPLLLLPCLPLFFLWYSFTPEPRLALWFSRLSLLSARTVVTHYHICLANIPWIPSLH